MSGNAAPLCIVRFYCGRMFLCSLCVRYKDAIVLIVLVDTFRYLAYVPRVLSRPSCSMICCSGVFRCVFTDVPAISMILSKSQYMFSCTIVVDGGS